MPDTAANVLAPSDPWNPDAPPPPPPPPPDGSLPATIAAPAPSMPPTEMQPVQPDLPALSPEAAPDYKPGEREYHEGFLHKILDKVGTILGGDQTYRVTKHADGTVTGEYDPSTTGEKWGRIASAALGGAAQGLANSQGPGGLAKAGAAGAQFGLQQAQNRESEDQKRLLNAAQIARLNQEIVKNAWENKSLPEEYTQRQTKEALDNIKEMSDLGVEPLALGVKDHQKIAEMGAANPLAVGAHMGANGDMILNMPDGKGGVNFFHVPATVANQRTTSDWSFSTYALDPKDSGKTVETKHTVKAGQDRNGERFKNQMGVDTENNKVFTQASENASRDDKANKEKEPTTQDAAIISKWKQRFPNDPAKALEEATNEIQRGKRELRSITNVNTAPATPEGLANWGTLLSDPESGVTLANVPQKQREQVINAMKVAGQKIAKPLTAQELNRADLAHNAISNIEEAQSILERRPDMFGPAGWGRTKFSQLLKGGDRDALAYQTAINLANLPAVGIHGVRGRWALEDLSKLDSNLYNNADSMRDVLNEIHRSASEFGQQGGRRSESGAPATTGTAKAGPATIQWPTTPAPQGETWVAIPGQTPGHIPIGNVKAFKAKHPDGQVQP